MSYETERQAIQTRFATAWKTTTPVAYEGVAFTPPIDGSAFVELWILNGDGYQASLGPKPLYRYAGVIQVTISTKAGKGVTEAVALADKVTPIFRSAQFSGITCKVPYRSPSREEGGRLVVDVSIPFTRDE